MAAFHEIPNLDPAPSSPPGQRILLVDEDANDLRYFTQLLEQMDYSVWAFTNYREAERYLADGYFDLVIVGQGGPGFELLRLVEFTLGRERYTPVVVLARILDITTYLQAIQFGASDYLVKPLSPEELERVVITHCQPQHHQAAASSSGGTEA